MLLLLLSFVAGILTVLAPCVLPLLPIIIGGAAQDHRARNPYIITASLASAIVLFTLLLKFSSAFINIPPQVWSTISGVIIVGFGLITIFPGAWERFNIALGLSRRSDEMLAKSATSSRWGDVFIGASLGPVFSSCSPTYFLILATILPRSLGVGIVYLIAYAAGLSLILLLISILGQKLIQRLRFAADPRGWFKRGLGILFVLVGIFILTGTNTNVQTYLQEYLPFNISNVEERLLERTHAPEAMEAANSDTLTPNVAKQYPRYHEITNPSGYVNSEAFKLSDLIGKKVILLDFMTYSCINCIRTFPYLNAWYDKYKDQGLEVVAIHTPEFAFEKNIQNVRNAMQRYGITFPVVLDNDYGTWNAYNNNYWPRKYLIDADGYIVYDHIGEGGYDETEKKIQELLKAKNGRDAMEGLVQPAGALNSINAQSPETYFGFGRNEYLGNGESGVSGEQNYILPTATPAINTLFLGGTWNMSAEYATNLIPNSRVLYHYKAQRLYFVASSETIAAVEVLRDGKPLNPAIAGKDITFKDGRSYLSVKEDRLYDVINDTQAGDHVLEFIIEKTGLNAYTFTFG